jgi:hypothetical protein
LHLKCPKSQYTPMALHKWFDSFKEWKSHVLTNRNSPFFTRQKPTQPSIEDQGKDRTHHHNVRHEVKRGFPDLDPTLIGSIVWPLCIDMGFWNYFFWVRTNHSQNMLKAKELEYNENIKEKERERYSHWISVCDVQLVKCDSDRIFPNKRPCLWISY